MYLLPSALVVVYTAYCALQIVRLTLHYMHETRNVATVAFLGVPGWLAGGHAPPHKNVVASNDPLKCM